MKTVLLDTNIIVGLLNKNDPLNRVALEATHVWEARDSTFPLSIIVWSEILTGTIPLGDKAVAGLKIFRDEYFSHTVPVDIPIANEAAKLRADDRALRLPDALVLATATHVRADVLLTGDKQLKKFAPDLIELVIP